MASHSGGRLKRLPPGTIPRVLGYGAVLAVGTATLQLLDYQSLVRDHLRDLYIALIAAAFLAGGVALGMRLMASPAPVPSGNPAARARLGISDREMDVLRLLAGGRSNKEIAQLLSISPHTVKTHVARLYEKLGAERRTDAVARAQALDLVP